MTTLAAILTLAALGPQEDPDPLTARAARRLVSLQEADGAWPYEGVYRVGGEIPVGYRVGGTAVTATALLYASGPGDAEARRALERGTAFVVEGIRHPLLRASTENAYDVRVWGQAYALDFLCRLRAADPSGRSAPERGRAIQDLTRVLLAQELPGGGWSYAGREVQGSFVTAPVIQALLWARAAGAAVPDEVFARARRALEAGRADDGAFLYAGAFAPGAARSAPDGAAGSSARSALCEVTLRLLGGGSEAAVRGALDAFHRHWGELEKRRGRTGTHEGPHSIAPYYFYFGHRYAAQAIGFLPEAARPRERERLREVVLKTRDPDDTWNDRVFPRSRAYGTAMALLTLLGERVPAPPPWRP